MYTITHLGYRVAAYEDLDTARDVARALAQRLDHVKLYRGKAGETWDATETLDADMGHAEQVSPDVYHLHWWDGSVSLGVPCHADGDMICPGADPAMERGDLHLREVAVVGECRLVSPPPQETPELDAVAASLKEVLYGKGYQGHGMPRRWKAFRGNGRGY